MSHAKQKATTHQTVGVPAHFVERKVTKVSTVDMIPKMQEAVDRFLPQGWRTLQR